jgi:hypothetical protein
MLTKTHLLIQAGSVTQGWGELFQRLMQPSVTEAGPVMITLSEVQDHSGDERTPLRLALDQKLQELGMASVLTVANTIFPWSYWDPSQKRSVLFERFKRSWPQIKRCRGNQNGHYFHRMTNFGEGEVNQLEKIFRAWEVGVRRASAFQLPIFDPNRDHVPSLQRGFPCLQQVSFLPSGKDGQDGVRLGALYPTQHVFPKAFGNYLGLSRLGKVPVHREDRV